VPENIDEPDTYEFLSKTSSVSGFEPVDVGNTGSLCNGSTAAAARAA
jgi:hypothetical protein